MSRYDYYPSFRNDFGDLIPASPRIDLEFTDPNFNSNDFSSLRNVILDSGADRTLIRVEILSQFPISPSGRARNVPGLGKSGDLFLIPYEVGIAINSVQIRNLAIFGYLGTEDAILGRDVLNLLSIHLNGPSLELFINS